MGSEYPCCDRSFSLSSRILRSVTYLHSLANSNILPIATWIAGGGSGKEQNLNFPEWGNLLVIAGLAMSMTVNALATGLIVFKIWAVFREVKLASDDPTFGATPSRGNKLRSVIFILIESGLTLFLIQFGRLVVTVMNTVDANYAFKFFVCLHQQLNVIIILVFLIFIALITSPG